MTEAQGVIELRQMISEARADIVHADQKASAILASVGVGFTVLLGGQLAAGWSFRELEGLSIWLWWISVAFVIVGLICCALALWPRLSVGLGPTDDFSYWGQATQFADARDIATVSMQFDGRGEIARRSVQLLALARIARWKFVLLRLTLVVVGLAGLLLGGVAIFSN